MSPSQLLIQKKLYTLKKDQTHIFQTQTKSNFNSNYTQNNYKIIKPIVNVKEKEKGK